MTWHTRSSFFRTAEDLEDEYLRAQIDNAAMLVDMVLDNAKQTEPAYYLWKDNLEALLVMGMAMSMEWTFASRFDDKTFWKFSRLADQMAAAGTFNYEAPPWFRDEALIMSHRSALIRRDGTGYGELWPSAPRDMPILWPDPIGGSSAVANLRVAKADLADLRAGRLSVPSQYADRVVNNSA